MNRNEILRAVLKKAVDNGFELHPHKHFMTRNRETGEMFGYESIIFDHGFAQIIWPEEPVLGEQPGYFMDKKGNQLALADWQYHIMQMAVDPDPLKYLAANT